MNDVFPKMRESNDLGYKGNSQKTEEKKFYFIYASYLLPVEMGVRGPEGQTKKVSKPRQKSFRDENHEGRKIKSRINSEIIMLFVVVSLCIFPAGPRFDDSGVRLEPKFRWKKNGVT